jgi:hypothetical protein
MRFDSALEFSKDSKIERSFVSGILCKGEKQARVLSTHRAFVLKMNFCSWEGSAVNVYTRQTAPPSRLFLSSQFAQGHNYAVRCPFCKGDQSCFFKWALGMDEFAAVFHTFLHDHPREHRHSLQGKG